MSSHIDDFFELDSIWFPAISEKAILLTMTHFEHFFAEQSSSQNSSQIQWYLKVFEG